MKICIMIVDSLRPDHLGCYGYPKNTSPRIDQIASGCTHCANVYAQSNWTYPSVYSMLTGRYPTVLSVSWFDQKVNHTFKLLPMQLANIGFRTAIFSKFKVLLNGAGFCSHFNEVQEVSVDQNAFEVFGRWLDRHGNDFLFFHIGEYVHEPYFAPDPSVQRFVEDQQSFEQMADSELFRALTDRDTTGNTLRKITGNINKGLQSVSKAEIDYLFAHYDAGIYYIDEIVEKFYDMLRAQGDDYLFVLTADHGQAFMEHGYFGHGLSLYNEVIKVPLIIDHGQRYQGRLDTGLQLIDLYPTILECLGMESDADIDGISFWDGLASQKTPERTILAEGFPHVSIIEGRHKLISDYGKHWNMKEVYRQFMRGRTASWPRLAYSYWQRFRKPKLFDLDTDANERKNLARTQKEITRRLHRSLGRVMQSLLQKSLPAEEVCLDPIIEDQLAKLGYL